MKKIILDFDNFKIESELFNNKIAEKFYNILPIEINLTKWGDELYGSIGEGLGEENPYESIPAGGLAYTNKGNYFCIFFGQRPAWEVEYIGKIINNEDIELLKNDRLTKVKIKRKEEE